MSNRSAAISLSTRTVKIYASAFDATARTDIAEHVDDFANPHAVTAEQVGLGAVENLAPAALPISDATAAALLLKAPLDSPVLVGIPTAPTAALGTVTKQLATVEFVQAALNALDISDTTEDELAAHLADNDNPHQVTKSQVGLGNVDNTADADKPVSTATQTAINVASSAAAAAQADIDGHQADTNNPHAVSAADVGLGNVANLAPADLPVSTATQTALNAANANTALVAADLDLHLADTNNPHAVSKADVGLGAVDNTSDAAKPVSDATQAAINAAVAASGDVAADLAAHLADTDNPHAVTKSDVGLGSVDNTSDAAKPISAPTQSALNLKAPLDSAALTGTPTAPTAAPLTNTTQLATTAYADAGTAALLPSIADAADAADDAQITADAAQAAADAAQADATAALALIEAEAAAVYSRPGDAIGHYGSTKTGPPAGAVPIDPAWVAVSSAGSVVRITAATAADPQTVAPITAYPLEPGRIYEVRWRVQRQTNPVDPLNDSVQLGVAWLTSTKAGNGAAAIANLPLVFADGVQERAALVGIAPPSTVALNYIAPAGTIYFRPFVDCYGDAHVTDIVTIDVLDVTPSFNPPAVQIVAPASGASIAMADLRPLYIDNPAVLAALTIRLPPNCVSGDLAELGFRSSVTALVVQDSAGAAIAGSPTNAYGPGSALEFLHVGSGWVHWK